MHRQKIDAEARAEGNWVANQAEGEQRAALRREALLDIEPFQRCRSRVRMAAAIDDIRFGLHRALRKIRQDFSRATPRSAGVSVPRTARG